MKNNIKQLFEDRASSIERSTSSAADTELRKERRKTLNVETRIIDQDKGIVDYVASDESIDSYGEIVLANGWRFNRFQKNAPFVDSHRYDCIDRLLGKVVSWEVKGNQLIERVQWSIDNPEHTLAQIGWKLTVSGFLKGVSVGFIPIRYVARWSGGDGYFEQLQSLGLDTDAGVSVIYQEQEQIELSAVIIGANGNAVAKAFKADALTEEDIDTLYEKTVQLNRRRAPSPGNGTPPDRQAKSYDGFLSKLKQLTNH